MVVAGTLAGQRGACSCVAFVDVVCHHVSITVFLFFTFFPPPFFLADHPIAHSAPLSFCWLARPSRTSTPSHCFTHPTTSLSLSHVLRSLSSKHSRFASPFKKDESFCYEKKGERLFCLSVRLCICSVDLPDLFTFPTTITSTFVLPHYSGRLVCWSLKVPILLILYSVVCLRADLFPSLLTLSS